jgi:proteic killer suppression protein
LVYISLYGILETKGEKMIQSFADRGTADIYDGSNDIYDGSNTKRARETLSVQLHSTAKRKLDLLNAAVQLKDLRVPPGNRLEPLTGDLRGKHSIRINDQWRIIFSWSELGAQDVEIIDYH